MWVYIITWWFTIRMLIEWLKSYSGYIIMEQYIVFYHASMIPEVISEVHFIATFLPLQMEYTPNASVLFCHFITTPFGVLICIYYTSNEVLI